MAVCLSVSLVDSTHFNRSSAFIYNKMSEMLSVILILIGLMSYSALARINLHEGPLFSAATSFTMELETTTLTKPTPCYVTSGDVSQCRRKRGIEENPQIAEISPSTVVGIETTRVPRYMGYNPTQKIFSSFSEASYYNSGNILQQLAANKGRKNVITVGDCGMSTVNFSQFLSCLGLNVQQTTTLTATFTETITFSSGYTTMTLAGCTPADFPYPSCSTDSDEITDNTTEFNNNIDSSTSA